MGFFNDYTGQGLFGALSGIQSIIDKLMAPVVIFEVLLAVLLYFTLSYTLMLIGRKARQTDDWMAFVPIAKDIYRLRFVDAPKWHVFFFGFTGTLVISVVEWLMITIFKSSFSPAFLVLGIILLLAYASASVYVTFQFLSRYYRRFGFHPMLAMVHFTPFINTFEVCFDLYFAYNRTVIFGQAEDEPLNNGRGFEQAPAQSAKAARRQGYISALNGKYHGANFEIADMEEIAFGRENPECQIIFDQFDTDVSRTHCSVRYNALENKYIVTDYSKNGTFTGEDHRLQPGVPVALPAGTIILLGSRKNMFRLG